MLEEENSYFKNVVREAIDDLLQNGVATVFIEDQVKAIKRKIEDVNVKYDGTFYKLSIDETQRKKLKKEKKKKND